MRLASRIFFFLMFSAGEHYVDIVGVAGSIPAVPTTYFSILLHIFTTNEITVLSSLVHGQQVCRLRIHQHTGLEGIHTRLLWGMVMMP